MSNNTNYYLKYLKYKNKYLSLKQRTDFTNSYLQNDNINQIGGEPTPKENMENFIRSRNILDSLINRMYREYVYNDEIFKELYTDKGTHIILTDKQKKTLENELVIGKILKLIKEMIVQITIVLKDHNNMEHKQVIHHLNMDNVGRTNVRLQENFFYIDLNKIVKCFIYICKILYVLDNTPNEIIKRLNTKRKEIIENVINI
jgi:hypothetical protein